MLTSADDILRCARIGNDLASSPASNNLFSIVATSALLSDKEKKFFHSTVAKLLYLSKRVRPDMLIGTPAMPLWFSCLWPLGSL